MVACFEKVDIGKGTNLKSSLKGPLFGTLNLEKEGASFRILAILAYIGAGITSLENLTSESVLAILKNLTSRKGV